MKLIVYDNGSLGFVAMEMKAAGYLDTGTDLKNPDFAAMANAMGIMGIRVDQSADVEPALREAFAHPGPALVDVVTAKQELAMPPKIRLEQAKGFSLFMLKAIINGRGDEVVELAKTNLFRGSDKLAAAGQPGRIRKPRTASARTEQCLRLD